MSDLTRDDVREMIEEILKEKSNAETHCQHVESVERRSDEQ